MTEWTPASIQELAPNALVYNRSKSLARAKLWEGLGGDGSYLWGLCRSQGERTYECIIQIDGGGKARCSCSSRFSPCRHSLGLLWMLLRHNDRFSRADALPPWAALLLRQPPPEPPALPPSGSLSRLGSRLSLMAAGVDELDQWLQDLARQGISSLGHQPEAFWERIAARMVDAKMGSIGRRLRGMPQVVEQPGWQHRVQALVAELYLFVQAFRQIASLSIPMQEEVLAYAGVNQKKEELLAGEGVMDNWLVIGLSEGEEEKLRYRRTWLLGEVSGKYALLLDFVWGNARFEGQWALGSALQAEVVFYPGAYPVRGLLKKHRPWYEPLERLSGYASVSEFGTAYAQALRHNPWLYTFPALLSAVAIREGQGGQWLAVDANGDGLPLNLGGDVRWALKAVAQEQPVAMFGQWEQGAFLPVAALSQGRVINLQDTAPDADEE